MFIILGIIFVVIIKDYWLLPILLRTLILLVYSSYSLGSLLRGVILIDKIRLLLVYLRILIIVIIFFARRLFYYKSFYLNQYKILLILLTLFLVLCFSSLDLINFYIWFERSLIPIFLIVYGWGVQPERLEASIYLIGYTLLGSFPLFLFVIFLNVEVFRLGFINWSLILFKFEVSKFYLIVIYGGFLVKIPIFILHLWLPKVHVEASLSGSIILAAILLKLGAYGLIRLISFNFVKSSFFLVLRVLGGVYVAFFCLRQTDLKTLVAYSSVVHIRFIIGGCFSEISLTYLRVLLIIISHGLSSSCLFYLVNFFYERTGSRSILINKGMSSFIPVFILWWIFFSAFSIAVPFRLRFFSEIFLILNIIVHSKVSVLVLGLISIFTSCYVIFIFSFTQLGASPLHFYFSREKFSDHLVCFSHGLLLLLGFLYINLF